MRAIIPRHAEDEDSSEEEGIDSTIAAIRCAGSSVKASPRNGFSYSTTHILSPCGHKMCRFGKYVELGSLCLRNAIVVGIDLGVVRFHDDSLLKFGEDEEITIGCFSCKVCRDSVVM